MDGGTEFSHGPAEFLFVDEPVAEGLIVVVPGTEPAVVEDHHVDPEVSRLFRKVEEPVPVEIEQEGIVLAKNDNNVLPLAKNNKKINIFGFNSVDWYISNSGSGSAGAGTGQKSWGLLEALDAKGVEYNADLINYYKGWAGALDKSASYSNDYENTYRLTNPSLSNDPDYKAVYEK